MNNNYRTDEATRTIPPKSSQAPTRPSNLHTKHKGPMRHSTDLAAEERPKIEGRSNLTKQAILLKNNPQMAKPHRQQIFRGGNVGFLMGAREVRMRDLSNDKMVKNQQLRQAQLDKSFEKFQTNLDLSQANKCIMTGTQGKHADFKNSLYSAQLPVIGDREKSQMRSEPSSEQKAPRVTDGLGYLGLKIINKQKTIFTKAERKGMHTTAAALKSRLADLSHTVNTSSRQLNNNLHGNSIPNTNRHDLYSRTHDSDSSDEIIDQFMLGGPLRTQTKHESLFHHSNKKKSSSSMFNRTKRQPPLDGEMKGTNYDFYRAKKGPEFSAYSSQQDFSKSFTLAAKKQVSKQKSISKPNIKFQTKLHRDQIQYGGSTIDNPGTSCAIPRRPIPTTMSATRQESLNDLEVNKSMEFRNIKIIQNLSPSSRNIYKANRKATTKQIPTLRKKSLGTSIQEVYETANDKRNFSEMSKGRGALGSKIETSTTYNTKFFHTRQQLSGNQSSGDHSRNHLSDQRQLPMSHEKKVLQKEILKKKKHQYQKEIQYSYEGTDHLHTGGDIVPNDTMISRETINSKPMPNMTKSTISIGNPEWNSEFGQDNAREIQIQRRNERSGTSTAEKPAVKLLASVSPKSRAKKKKKYVIDLKQGIKSPGLPKKRIFQSKLRRSLNGSQASLSQKKDTNPSLVEDPQKKIKKVIPLLPSSSRRRGLSQIDQFSSTEGPRATEPDFRKKGRNILSSKKSVKSQKSKNSGSPQRAPSLDRPGNLTLRNFSDTKELANIELNSASSIEGLELADQQHLSTFVTRENMENSLLYNYIQRIEKKKDDPHNPPEEDGAKRPKDVQEVDTKKLQKDLLAMNQICSKLVASSEDQEPLLSSMIPQRLQVLSNSVPTIVRCKISGALCPVKIRLDYSLTDDISKTDLAIFYSFSSKNPSSDNCEKKMTNKPRSFLLQARDPVSGKKLPEFSSLEYSFVYISFESELGCSLEVTFMAEYSMPNNPKKVDKPSFLREHDQKKPSLIPKNDPYYQEMVEMRKIHQRRLREKQERQGGAAHIFNHPLLKMYHKQQASLKKEQLEENNYKQKFFLLHKWDFLKQIKAQLLQEQHSKVMRMNARKTLLVYLMLKPLLKKIAHTFKRKKFEHFYREKALFLGLYISCHMPRYIRRFGRSFKQRQALTVKKTFTFYHFSILKKPCEDRAKEIMMKTLKNMELHEAFVLRLRDTFFQIQFIQRKFRNLREIMKQRRHALRHSILMQQTFLINNSLLKSNSDANKQLSIKINQLSDEKKDFITDCFINLAKFDFRKQFLIWFRDTKLKEEQSDKLEEIQEGILQTDQMTTSLILFITHDNEDALKNLEKQEKKKPRLNLKKHQMEKSELLKQEAELEKNMEEHLKMKENMKRQKTMARHRSHSKSGKQLNQVTDKMKTKIDARTKAIKVFDKIFKRQEMPKFAIYSRLDKNLLKMMLIRATELEDRDIPEYRLKYFNPEKDVSHQLSDATLD